MVVVVVVSLRNVDRITAEKHIACVVLVVIVAATVLVLVVVFVWRQ